VKAKEDGILNIKGNRLVDPSPVSLVFQGSFMGVLLLLFLNHPRFLKLWGIAAK